MKNFVVLSLTASTVLVLSALLAVVAGWPGASSVLVVGLGAELVALLLFLAHRYGRWHEHPRRKLALLILLGGGALVVLAVYSSLAHWATAEALMVMGASSELLALVLYFSADVPHERG